MLFYLLSLLPYDFDVLMNSAKHMMELFAVCFFVLLFSFPQHISLRFCSGRCVTFYLVQANIDILDGAKVECKDMKAFHLFFATKTKIKIMSSKLW